MLNVVAYIYAEGTEFMHARINLIYAQIRGYNIFLNVLPLIRYAVKCQVRHNYYIFFHQSDS